MDASSATKIYPSADELSKVTSILHCPEQGCSGVFSSKSNLNLHLAKTHRKEHLLAADEGAKEYHCPESACVYHHEAHFKKLKSLKQHYLKVHSEKSHLCDSCGKGFPTEAAKRSHAEYCGVTFGCVECPANYPAYESLLTHGRRKKHKILEKTCYKASKSHSAHCSDSGSSRKEKFILPKGSVSLQLLCYKVNFDKSSQTELKTRLRRSKNTTKQTQTFRDGNLQISAETQTIGDHLLRTKSALDDNKKSMKTQTSAADSESKSCNTSFNIGELEQYVRCSSSGTQTSVPEPELLSDFEFIDTSSQTNFGFDVDTFLDNCNSETQTDFIFESGLINPDFCAHMCTQTGDDDFLGDLGLADMHTQTNAHEMLRSVESQTHVQRRQMLSCRDMAHIETQTEEFKQLLEEINA